MVQDASHDSLHSPRFSPRMAELGTEGAFEVLARARALEAQGRRIVHLEIGEPDFETAPHIVEAGVKALHDGFTHYGPTAGLPPVRAAIAATVSATRGLEISPDSVIVTPGGKPVIYYTILATCDAGDEVLIPDPSYPIYESVVRYVGAKPVSIPLEFDRGFRFDPEALRERVTPRTRLIILNSPHNPTGGVLTPSDLQAVADIAIKHNLWVLSDEIYSRIIYDDGAGGRAHHSIASIPGMLERTVILDGFSKAYAMTGWRLGYGIVPAPLLPHLVRLQVNVNSCTASFVQMAGIAALNGPQDGVDVMVAEFEARRELVVAGLNAIEGVECRDPGGAFYAFPRIEVPGHTSKEVADSLLAEEGVAILAGTAFGEYGENFLRLSFANSRSEITEGLARIRHGIERLRKH
ncbi:MAG: pyridoxal phosphate-dependent aminotransferase [Proteobacteria bacterium]|nr:pyridoxal phosphate-dependent aminotransferase [Pseudomonadota bacterium]NDE06835.1 pyridoxal phosphate-dependent aminotransferase [Chloroflexota bacterium]NBT01892.1 pyridoxal phosphate-dependent aminotransferase [Pseudomonadota bacterium]NBY46902.1 pyridoxal phosphate-dependent aminotransferase [Pseudomonadota bacterium]NDF52921.1 pyridoxal phosphate-dependent aminotransferase [Pseudomonadota bacterium]